MLEIEKDKLAHISLQDSKEWTQIESFIGKYIYTDISPIAINRLNQIKRLVWLTEESSALN